MAVEMVTKKQILEELSDLEPDKWAEVLDFIAYLKYRASREAGPPHTRELTARALRESALVGLWEDRQDIGDSLDFARSLRRAAEHRVEDGDDPA